MDRPNLRGRVPDAVTTRLPGGESDGSGTATDGPSDASLRSDSDGSDGRRWTTLLTLAGLGLAGLGVTLRYVLDRRGDEETGDETERDRPEFDRDATGTVEIVGDTGSGATDTADGTESDGAIDGDEAAADERDVATESDGPTPTANGTETDVAVETFEADRPGDDGATETDDGETDADRDGPPRIAPLVGMVALVGARLFVEHVRKRPGDAPGTADQL